MTTSEEQAILEQLENLNSAKAAIRNAIASKYVEVSESTPFINYADAIKMIGSGVGGTYGKSKVAMPLPPEGNYGGGVNPKLAWKKGQVATLIKTAVDYPAESPTVIANQAQFDAFVSYNVNDSTSDPDKYKNVILKSNDDAYIAKHTIDFISTGTKKFFGENGAKINWDSKISGNISSSSTGNRFLFQASGNEQTFIYNLQIRLKNAEDRVSDSIYFLRGIEVTALEGTPAYGDLFVGFDVMSRVYVETWGYKNVTKITPVTPEKSIDDIRSDQGCVIQSKGQMSDVTIYNKSTTVRGYTAFGVAASATPKLLRCFVFGAFDQGIDLGINQSAQVDRCYVQSAYGAFSSNANAQHKYDSFGIRAGKIINSTIQQFDIKIDQQTNLDNQSSFAIYGSVYVSGCKVGQASGSALVGIFGKNKVTDSAIVNYTLNGVIAGKKASTVIKSDTEITNCAVYEVNVAGQGNNTSDVEFKVLNVTGNGKIETNHIGQVFIDINRTQTDTEGSLTGTVSAAASAWIQGDASAANSVWASPATATSAAATAAAGTKKTNEKGTKWLPLILNFEMVDGATTQKNNRIDSVYLESGSHKLGRVTLFTNAAEVDNNYVGSFDFSAHHRDNYDITLFALINTKDNGTIINNVFDQINGEITGKITGKFYCFKNAKTIKNNRVSSVKIRDAGRRYIELKGTTTLDSRQSASEGYKGGASYTLYSHAMIKAGTGSSEYFADQEENSLARTVQLHLIIGAEVVFADTVIEGNSFGLLFNEKKQPSSTAIKIIGILNNSDQKATIKNNYFKNISVMAEEGIAALTAAKLVAKPAVSELAACGIALGSNTPKCIIENNELNVECLCRVNATRNSPYAVTGSAVGIDSYKKFNTIAHNIISVKGQAQTMRCVEITETATNNAGATALPDAPSDGNTFSLENLALTGASNFLVKNMQSLRNTKLREGRFNTINDRAAVYVSSFASPKTEDTEFVTYEIIMREDDDTIVKTWYRDANNNNDKVKATEAVGTMVQKAGSASFWVVAETEGDKYYAEAIKKTETRPEAKPAKPAEEDDNNELPVSYHVYI
jgi:hypothetical protein